MMSLGELLEHTKLMLKDLEQVMRGKPIDKTLLEQKAVVLFEVSWARSLVCECDSVGADSCSVHVADRYFVLSQSTSCIPEQSAGEERNGFSEENMPHGECVHVLQSRAQLRRPLCTKQCSFTTGKA